MSPKPTPGGDPSTTHSAPATSTAAGVRLDDLALCDPDVLAAAAELSEQHARQRIAAGWPEDDALARAADDALGYARRMVADQVRRQYRQLALDAVIDAYGGNTYRLLRDLADTVDASLAYIDRTTVEAHLERSLSDAEWAAANEQFHAMDFDDAVGDQSRFRTDWIETILERSGVPGQGSGAARQSIDSGASGAA